MPAPRLACDTSSFPCDPDGLCGHLASSVSNLGHRVFGCPPGLGSLSPDLMAFVHPPPPARLDLHLCCPSLPWVPLALATAEASFLCVLVRSGLRKIFMAQTTFHFLDIIVEIKSGEFSMN